MKTIYILDFTEYPGLRHCDISDDSGEEYYHKVLNKEFKESYQSKDILNVDLDNTAGFAPSFLDEAFGNLIYDFGLAQVNKYLKVTSNQEPDWIEMLKNETFKQWEDRRIHGIKPKKTLDHKPWFRLVSGELKHDEWS